MVSLNSLSAAAFSSTPGNVPVCRRKGSICTLPIREITGNSYVCEYYPEININHEMFNALNPRCIDSHNLILPTYNEHALKRVTRTFFESGFRQALQEAANLQISNFSPAISLIAQYTLRGLDLFSHLKVLLIPRFKKQEVASIGNFSQTRNWAESCIRYIEWHPNCFQMAVAGSDDIIRIYKGEPAVALVLNYLEQHSISSMAWRPFSAGELAVGCQSGICYWNIDGNLNILKPTSQVTVLRHSKHFPVTSVEWSSEGSLLASCSINDNDILIWNVDKLESVPLKCVGPPCALLKWSPKGSYLFSSTVGNVFRIWSTESFWQPERWTVATGTVQSAAWSPCGSFLLFVSSIKPILYRLDFVDERLFASNNFAKQAHPIADLTKVTLNHREIGGPAQAISWDPNGKYLAIIFLQTSSVAIFATAIAKNNLSITASCFLTGIELEYPSFICFQSKNLKNSDSVLTIGWSSGRIQYFPFVNM